MLVRLADHYKRLGDMNAFDGEMTAAEILEMSRRGAIPIPRELGAFLKNIRREVFSEFCPGHLAPSYRFQLYRVTIG